MMGIEVNVNLSEFKQKLSQKSFTAGRRDVADQFDISAQPFIPKRRGDLRAHRIIAIDGSSIIYMEPYAGRLFSKQFINYHTPGTGPHWDAQVKHNYMPQLVKAFVDGSGLNG